MNNINKENKINKVQLKLTRQTASNEKLCACTLGIDSKQAVPRSHCPLGV